MAASMNRPADDAVRLHPYTVTWRWRFSLERIWLWLSLWGQVLKLEHVGSTDIPSMPAKPIIDIMVVRDRSSSGG